MGIWGQPTIIKDTPLFKRILKLAYLSSFNLMTGNIVAGKNNGG